MRPVFVAVQGIAGGRVPAAVLAELCTDIGRRLRYGGAVDVDYVEAVLDVVDAIPAGSVMTYGDVAAVVARQLERGGPRQVGAALRDAGAAVPWWRVVRASGLPPAHKISWATERLRAEGCPFTGDERVDLRRARQVP